MIFELNQRLFRLRLIKSIQQLVQILAVNEVVDIFNALKFDVSVEGETFIVTVPTRRGDITIEADLVEEVARIIWI